MEKFVQQLHHNTTKKNHKQDFHVPAGVYLLNHSVGCIPKQVAQEIESDSYWTQWRQQGSLAWPQWLKEIESFKIELSGFLNCQPEFICPQVNVSSGVAKIIPSLPQRKNRIQYVISKMDFPSVGFALAQAKYSEENIVWVESENYQTPFNQWEKKLTRETQLVIVSHATYGNSFLNPVADICALARDGGIFSLVDVTQSIGVVPLDITAWNPDFVVGSCVKWLCGGTGAGFLWVNQKLCEHVNPKDVGWFSHKNPFEFDIENFEYAHNAHRFFGGTPSVGPYSLAKKSLSYLKNIGLENIRNHNIQLCQKLIESALSLDIKIVSPQDSEKRGGTVCLYQHDVERMTQAFSQANIHVDERPYYGVRFSPHIYNSLDDVEAVDEVLRYMAKS